jgi:WhiB family redox-sensing transcriptional regulator
VSWYEQAACRDADPDIFFPERGESLAPAKAICFTCPVWDDCYQTGLRQKFGVWAGTSERERRRLRRRLGIRLVEDLDDHEELQETA